MSNSMIVERPISTADQANSGQLWLGIRGAELACYDKNGDYIEGHLAAVAARAAAEAQAQAEAQARLALEARLLEAEAELRRLRAPNNQ